MRKKTFEDYTKMQPKVFPRSKSEVHTPPTEQSQQHYQQQQQQTTTSQIKPVSKFFFLIYI
jgi:hypothetical protein